MNKNIFSIFYPVTRKNILHTEHRVASYVNVKFKKRHHHHNKKKKKNYHSVYAASAAKPLISLVNDAGNSIAQNNVK